jgi:hypothetical protein
VNNPIRRGLPRFAALVALLVACASTPGHAAIFCVSTSAELLTALGTAANNNANDDIRLRAGVYTNPAGVQSAFYVGADDFAITVSGGWTNAGMIPCFARTGSPRATVIEGSATQRAMNFGTSPGTADITVQNMTFRGGRSSGPGAGLLISSVAGFAGDVLIDHVIFEDNHSELFGGGFSGGSDGGFFRMRDCLFVGNSGDDGRGYAGIFTTNAASPASTRMFVGNNTVVANACTAPPCIDGAFFFSGNSRQAVFNNLFVSNAGVDIRIATSTLELYANNYLLVSGIPAVSTDNVGFADPHFINAAARDFRLRRSSPLIDLGTIQFTLSATDLGGAPRILGNGPEIGAHEEDSIFIHGFEN